MTAEKYVPPSAWGASFWKTLDACERKHYYIYVLGLEVASGVKAPALECGSVFHDNREARLKDAGLRDLYGLTPADGPAMPKLKYSVDWRSWLLNKGVDVNKLEKYYDESRAYRQSSPPAWKEFPVEAGVWLDEEYELYWNSAQPTKDGVDPLLQRFTVEGVENTIILEDEDTLRRLGLLLPISAKYDTVVRLDNRSDRAYASLEHKTVGKAMQMDKYKRDIQIDTQLVCWNATHGPDDQMCGVIIDEANKAQKPGKRFRREMFQRTPQQTERFLINMRVRQVHYINVVQAAREIEEQQATTGTSEFAVAEAWQMREGQCYNYGECPFVKLCTYGKDALVMYNMRGPEHYEEPDEKEVE